METWHSSPWHEFLKYFPEQCNSHYGEVTQKTPDQAESDRSPKASPQLSLSSAWNLQCVPEAGSEIQGVAWKARTLRDLP